MLSPLIFSLWSSLCPPTSELPPAVHVALAREAQGRGDEKDARECVGRAVTQAPKSAFVHKEQAILHYRANLFSSALQSVNRALELGDPDPETLVLKARILALLGERETAAGVAQDASTEEGTFVAAALGHEGAGYQLAEHVGEETERGAITALVLSGAALRAGQARTASVLAQAALDSAESAASADLAQAADDLLARSSRADRFRFGARLRSAIEHDSNPSFLASEEFRQPGLRAAFGAAGGAQGSVGPFLLSGGAEVEQHLYLNDRDELRMFDVFGLAVNVAAFVPVSSDPSFVVVGVHARFSDVWGDRFGLHFSTELEGGPVLRLRLAPRVGFSLAFHGVVTDFIDLSPADDTLSSVNRDRIGQRGLATMLVRFDDVVWAIDGTFFRDDAAGDAFDMVGATAGTRVVVFPDSGLSLHAGVAITVREVGPVGDAVIGAAALRTEFRTALDAGVRFSLFPPFDVVVQNRYRHVAARRGHGYSSNIVSLGMEVTW